MNNKLLCLILSVCVLNMSAISDARVIGLVYGSGAVKEPERADAIKYDYLIPWQYLLLSWDLVPEALMLLDSGPNYAGTRLVESPSLAKKLAERDPNPRSYPEAMLIFSEMHKDRRLVQLYAFECQEKPSFRVSIKALSPERKTQVEEWLKASPKLYWQDKPKWYAIPEMTFYEEYEENPNGATLRAEKKSEFPDLEVPKNRYVRNDVLEFSTLTSYKSAILRFRYSPLYGLTACTDQKLPGDPQSDIILGKILIDAYDSAQDVPVAELSSFVFANTAPPKNRFVTTILVAAGICCLAFLAMYGWKRHRLHNPKSE